MRALLSLLLLLALPLHAEPLPRPDHVLIVVEENRGFKQIMSPQHADSWLHGLVKRGALLTRSHGVTHPSQPNYLALFSGTTHGISSNDCQPKLSGDNLASSLQQKGATFLSYAEGLPKAGDTVCAVGPYQRKHNPVSNWPELAALNLPFSQFPQDFSQLPTVALVVPDQDHDMHDGSFTEADNWLKRHIGPYVEWAFKHNSLLILTWDEDDYRQGNHIVTLLVGPMVKPGQSDQIVNHYHILRTVLDFYGATPVGASRDATSLQGIWR